jgi:hypothetical protein
MQSEDGHLKAEAIIAGVDATGPHVYHVDDPGQSTCHDNAGFFAIGIGWRHFETVFMAQRYAPTRDFYDALLLTFSAKRQAEMAPGVGRATDMIIMEKNGSHVLPPNEVEAIGSCHDDLTQQAARMREIVVYTMRGDMIVQPVRKSGRVAPAESLGPPKPEIPKGDSAVPPETKSPETK